MQDHTFAMLHLIKHLTKVAFLFLLVYSIYKSSVTPLSLHVTTLGLELPKTMLRLVRELPQVFIEWRLFPPNTIHHVQVELSLIRLISLNVLAIALSHSMLEFSE